MKNDHARLIKNPNTLKLKFISENFKQLAVQTAVKNLDHTAYLEALIEGKSMLRHENSIKKKIKNAKFPYKKSIEQFNFNHPSKISRMQIENILRLDFISREACVKGFSILIYPHRNLEVHYLKGNPLFIRTFYYTPVI